MDREKSRLIDFSAVKKPGRYPSRLFGANSKIELVLIYRAVLDQSPECDDFLPDGDFFALGIKAGIDCIWHLQIVYLEFGDIGSTFWLKIGTMGMDRDPLTKISPGNFISSFHRCNYVFLLDVGHNSEEI